MGVRVVLIVAILSSALSVAFAEQTSAPIVFPRENSIVGSKINLVLDPTEVPFFQVTVGDTEYPLVDTSTGRHAYQGLDLPPGLNTITVKVYAPSSTEEQGKSSDNDKKERDKSKKGLVLVSTWERHVFSLIDLVTGRVAPKGFARQPFHSREHEANCSSCHRMDMPSGEMGAPKKPEEMICYVCHKNVATGKHIHGPVAVWNCIACHNPEIYPVKYQFVSVDPWNVSKTTQPVEPRSYTFSSAEIFKPLTATFISKEKSMQVMKDLLDYIKMNPSDKIRVEAHTDNTPFPAQTKSKRKTKLKEYKNSKTLTDAQAKVIISLIKEAKIVPVKNFIAAGMGDKLPKAPNSTKESRDLNNRIEVVVYPADANVKNSQNLPKLKDRERVLINLSYAQGPAIRKLSLIEKTPKGFQYLKGSGYFRNKAKEPKKRGDELVWELGDMDRSFSESLYYVVKKDKETAAVPASTKAEYLVGSNEVVRDFDSQNPVKIGMTIKETCLKCHEDILSKKIKHGPVEAGLCTVCHNPHASPYNAWLRKPTWDLCTTCHAEKATGIHVVAGFVSGKSHPTRLRWDPSRPGKRITCASCHEPHGAENRQLFVLGIMSRNELCSVCHQKN